MKSFEDLDFYCLDNLPPVLLPGLLEVVQAAGRDRVAVALDVRTHGRFGEGLEAIEAAGAGGDVPEVLFLDARDEVLVRRYSETRRKHPFAHKGPLSAAIAAERDSLAPLRARADEVWDTSELTQGALKVRIAQRFGEGSGEHRIQVAVVSFGYKYGLPLDADLVFDVRYLPNPNYIDALRPLTGLDPEVRAYLEAQAQTAETIRRFGELLDYLMPQYADEGKSALTIAVGCTGGRHRSVYVAAQLAAHVAAAGPYDVITVNRDAER